jgi:hypothetical protein
MLSELLHQIARMKAEEEGEHVYRPRPSLAGPERCIRALTYAAMKTPPSKHLAGRMFHVFEDGHLHAMIVGAWIEQTAYKLHSAEMPVTCWADDELVLEGSIDGIVTDPLGKDFLLELKALNHFTFQRIAAGAPPWDYVTQVAAYLRGIHADNPALTAGVLLIKNKNTAQYLEFLIRYDWATDCCDVVHMTLGTGEVIPINQRRERIVGAAVDKFKAVEAHAQAGTLPDRPIDFTPGEFPCSYCSWEDTCWKDFAAETIRGGEVVLPLDTNAEVFAEQYLVLVERARQAEADKATHRDRLLTIMRGAQATKAKAGRFVLTRSVSQRPGKLNEEALDFATKQRIASARGTATVVEVLRVRDPITPEFDAREEGR